MIDPIIPSNALWVKFSGVPQPAGVLPVLCFFIARGVSCWVYMNAVFLREFAAALQLSREKGVGAAAFRRLLDLCGMPSLALEHWLASAGHNKPMSRQSRQKSATAAMIEIAVEKVASGEMQGCYYSQSGYPSQLNDLGEPPPVLFSSSAIRPAKFAAVVGARKLSIEAVQPACEMVRQLVAEGYAIVSGGAEGADAIALKQSLDLGAYTAAVFATGLDVIYPAANIGLFETIKHSGVLLSEMMPGARPQRSFFPARNRIIAALADVVAVIQAGENSGSLISAAWASRLGRRLLVLPPPNDADPAWAGNRRLIEAGAGVFHAGGKAFSVAEPVKDFFAAGEQLFTGF